MLRRKLLYNLGPLILLLFITAVGIIWQLEEVLADIRHVHDHADIVVSQIDDLSVDINRAEVEIYQLETGRDNHLDALVHTLSSMDNLIKSLDASYICHDQRGGPLYEELTRQFPLFRQQISALATVQDPGLAKHHNESALAVALKLRQTILPLSQYAQEHARREQEEVITRFRRLVMVLAVVFLVVINLAVVALLRMAGMILRPVDKLVDATRSLAAERFDARVQLDQNDEFGELALAYNNMAERLETAEKQRLESISQVALTMNHELNNAMSIIELQMQVLTRKSDGNPAQEQCLKQIRSSLERMTQTVGALKRIRRVVLTDYLPGTKMLDLSRSTDDEESISSTPSDSAAIVNPPVATTESMKKTTVTRTGRRAVLLGELQWFVQLRWLAGFCVVLGAILDWRWLHWSESPRGLFAIGVCILLYNTVLFRQTRTRRAEQRPSRTKLYVLSGIQVFLDLAGLMLICLWTGGSSSPFIAFFVFHMVFASLLLPWRIAYGGALIAALMMMGGLLLTLRFPQEREAILRLAVFCFTLFFTVHLANHLTRALRQQRRKLQRRNKRIHAMTRKLQMQQQAMVQHEKMVALGHMAAGVTHEITNPLASMDSLLQLMLRSPQRLTPENLNTLRDQTARINRIVLQMKAFAHPAHTQSETIPMNQVVERALGILKYDSRLKRVRIETDLMQDPPAIGILPQAMEQVLINLIQNAIDAMENSAAPMLTIRTRVEDDDSLIDVIDNGHGIAQTDLNRVFEPFFTTKPVGKGTGLGLSISYSLIQKQGGTLTAHNAAGGGARFTIRLPLKPAPSAPVVASRN